MAAASPQQTAFCVSRLPAAVWDVCGIMVRWSAGWGVAPPRTRHPASRLAAQLTCWCRCVPDGSWPSGLCPFFLLSRLHVPVAAVPLHAAPPPAWSPPPASVRAHDRASWNTMVGASSPWPARTVWRLPVTSGWVSSWYVRLRTALGAVVGSCIGGVRALWRACSVSVACRWSDGAESRAVFMAGSSRHCALMYWLGFVRPFSCACTATRCCLFRSRRPSPGLLFDVLWRSLPSPWIATACSA